MAAPWGAGRKWPTLLSSWKKPLPASARATRLPILRAEGNPRCAVPAGARWSPAVWWKVALRLITRPFAATDEPVLQEIAGRIAADEYRHYKLFYDILNAQTEPDIGFWTRLKIAIGRVRESDDDELAYAFYCANVPPEKEAITPYKRRKYSRMSAHASMTVYHRRHIQKLVQMVVKVVGANPHGWLANLAGALLWRRLQSRTA